MGSEEFVSNDRLRQARNLKGWSQAELAERIGTSFEMVSRWERGITVPSPHYRKRLSSVLDQAPEELGLVRNPKHSFVPPSSPFVLLAAAHVDAEKAIVSHLKTALKERGITLWNTRQIGKPSNGYTHATVWEVVQAADAILVVISPQSRSSRHVREALEIAERYQRPVCGIWLEGERWKECLPEQRVEFAAVIDAREGDTPGTLGAIAHLLFASQESPETERHRLADTGLEMVTQAHHPMAVQTATNPPERKAELFPPQTKEMEVAPAPSQGFLEPTNGAGPMPTPLLPHIPGKHTGPARTRVGLLIGLAILVVAGSLSLLTHFGVLGAHGGPSTVQVVRGGTWTYGLPGDPGSLIPNGALSGGAEGIMDQALYLPLFYGDAQGMIHTGAASEVPTIQNGGVSADSTTWAFHLRPGLLWSDGQSYDARDVNFTWKLWSNPKFGAISILGLNLINSADVSADHLSITFHLKQPFAPFLADLWTDGILSPLPAHHFSGMAPGQILKSSDNLNPRVVSGPFMMSESVPGDHYTVVRNPRYYLAKNGLPYLDKVVFTDVSSNAASLQKMQKGLLDDSGVYPTDVLDFPAMQRLENYTLIYPPTQNGFEALYFNFHNTVLADHPEVRLAMAMAVDQQTIITGALKGLGTPLCTDHPSAYHPGFEPVPPCPVFNLAAANQVLDDAGWVRGLDGVRAKGGQRLEFEYSTSVTSRPERAEVQAIIQRDFQQIGIKLDFQNYTYSTFFGSLLPQGKASPPTGAVADRYDIAEFEQNLTYDPDDSGLFACNQFPSAANNFTADNLDFYCNPALDKLFAQEQATADPGVRQQIFEQIHQIYLTQFPFIVLYSPTAFALAHKGTHNYLPGPFTDTYNIAEWWCDNGRC